ncbi:MAG TPA: D-glucuronyl C5-epimerase family protein [Solirubrobacteraceae bacterium]|nr:D-glucuronyl C5-epimerase family protein [Solirubrobacteraceae bacterium]
MVRTSVAGIALALLLALALASTASASPVLTLRQDGGTFVREDRFLPPDAGEPGLAARAPRAAIALRAAPATDAEPKRTVRGELARMLAAGEIDQPTYDRYRAIYDDAVTTCGKLSGARRAALGAVLRNTDAIAAGGAFIASRLPAVFETVARNRQWWTTGSLLRYGQRVSFQGSRLVWQYYTGEGLQIQWLGTFGKANGLWQGGTYDAQLRELLGEALGLAAQRAGGIAWEYLFDFDGGRPPWVSGLAQGTALQAYSRAAVRLNEPAFFQAARSALGIFREAPPSGVRVATPAGAHYLIYSFAPGLRVLNAFTQALNGLNDFALLANDAEGRALFAAGDAQLRTELPSYDTGAWSRYSLHREADLSYHTLARDFLRNLCTRLTDELTPAPVAAAAQTGGAVPLPVPPPAPVAPVADPAPYCAAAQRWTAYLAQPPKLALVSSKVRAGRPAAVRFTVDKPGFVTISLRRAGRTVAVLSARVGGGRRSLLWRHAPRGGGVFSVRLAATDLAGNAGAAGGKLRVLPARTAKR